MAVAVQEFTSFACSITAGISLVDIFTYYSSDVMFKQGLFLPSSGLLILVFGVNSGMYIHCPGPPDS